MATMKRVLHPELKAYFDSQLLNPTPAPFVEPRDPRRMLLMTALQCVGITEQGKDNHGRMVELFQSTIGHSQGEPWCLSFIQSCVAYVESFGFVSALFPTEHCLTAWENSKARRPVEPQAGDLILYRVGDTTKGHAALITSVHARNYSTVEGNTGPATNIIEREGDGVYTKLRPRGGFPKMTELGYLRLFDSSIV